MAQILAPTIRRSYTAAFPDPELRERGLVVWSSPSRQRPGLVDADLVPWSVRQRRKLVSELRDLIFRLSLVSGLGGALIWGLHHPPQPKHCPTHTHATKALSHCVAQTLSDIMLRWGFIIAGGAVAGCLIGVLVARLIPMPERTTRARL